MNLSNAAGNNRPKAKEPGFSGNPAKNPDRFTAVTPPAARLESPQPVGQKKSSWKILQLDKGCYWPKAESSLWSCRLPFALRRQVNSQK